MATNLFDSGAVEMAQAGFAFPEPLTEKYKPKRVADFMVDKPKRVMMSLLANPKSSAWFLLGASGMGKTEMALAFAAELPAQLHHIASKDCDLESVRKIRLACSYIPHDLWNCSRVCKAHVVVVDEADQASYPAQLAFLSLLDATGFPPNTIFIFTGNSTANLEDRFMSRVRVLEFSSYGMAEQITALLATIWEKEAGNAPAPNFTRITKDAKNNIREAINSIEVELMAV
jgi:replication-associated recombination protein RarA